jgi:predicted Zn-dependent protease
VRSPLSPVPRVHPKTRGARRAFRPRWGAPLLVTCASLALGACAVSQQQEVEIGANYATQIERELPLVRDPEVVLYVNVLGDSLAKVSDDRNLDWHFFVVDSREVNAFAVPGGYVYVNRGLIERAQTMNQVAGVIGHEIGHVTKRHSIKQMQKAQGANVGVTLGCILTRVCDSGLGQAAIEITAAGVFAKFSRDDEAEADAEGVRTVIRAGIDPQGIPEMFRILLAERKQKPDAVDAWFITHPLEEDRITTTQRLIGQYPADQLRGLTRDTPNFQAFKQRLASLPPSPERKR